MSSDEPVEKRPRMERTASASTSGSSSAPAGAAATGAVDGATHPQARPPLAMPQSFRELLGPYGPPDEAKDLEDTVRGEDGASGGAANAFAEFIDLPADRQLALTQSVRTLAAAVTASPSQPPSQGRLQQLCAKASRLSGFKDTARKSELTAAYRYLVMSGELRADPVLEDLLMRKRGRSHSGVLVITTFFGPSEFSCPKDCHYCPNQPGIARSYLLKEPAVLRGFRNDWDPIRQFRDRASALDKNGHIVDKIELIILGGTFSFYPKAYAEAFITASFYAANTYYDDRGAVGGSGDGAGLRPMETLEAEMTRNETAQCRIIGVTVETRPDYITAAELRRFRRLGVTRVQLGIQHLDDAVLTIINRDCPTIKTVHAIRLLLDAGFKVDAHWMPDLPGSSYAQDKEMFELLFSPENESFQVDQWKVYPTATVPFTRISDWYKDGTYKPYAEQDGGARMVDLLLYIMTHCPYRIRLNRIVRDIPTSYIIGGERRVNLRQVIERSMREQHVRCHDIRERECKGMPVDRAHTRLYTDTFRASDGTEMYLSVENEDRSQLYGHLRLRLRDAPSDSELNIMPVLTGCALIRELHTYGKLVAVHQHNTGTQTQHIGVGTQLMREAERIAKERGFTRIAVIAGVGVRRYYGKLGYELRDTYMVKELQPPASELGAPTDQTAHTAPPQEITEEQVLADNDNDNEDAHTPGFFSAVMRIIGIGGTSRK